MQGGGCTAVQVPMPPARSVLVIKWDPDKWPKELKSFTTQAGPVVTRLDLPRPRPLRYPAVAAGP